ncbi:MAG: DrmB family protein [Dermatophilaceae bacterium]
MTDTQLGQILHDPSRPLDPLGDAEAQAEAGSKRNFARVGSARPSSLLYTYGPGSIMDLPHFTVMPSGLDDWDRVWARRDGIPPTIHAPRLLEHVRLMLGPQVKELRPFPWQPKTSAFSREGSDLGVPARVFPQWMRCTGCDRLAPLSVFEYRNTHPYRTDLAVFEHYPCHGRGASGGGTRRRRPVVAARYLLACTDGHLDEFPYDWWVHRGKPCPEADVPLLAMTDRTAGKGAAATIVCRSCEAKRPMNEAQGEAGRAKLPRCRGRLPHLDGFASGGCEREPRLMLVGASNLWFPASQSVIVMPRLDPAEQQADDADRIRARLEAELLRQYAAAPVALLRHALVREGIDSGAWSDEHMRHLVELALAPAESEEARLQRREDWDPIDLLVPEWCYLQRDPLGERHADPRSGLTLSPRARSADLPAGVCRVLAVDRLRKVNALIGFTRIDELDRVNDLSSRLVSLTRTRHPEWTVATEDRGEGVFLQLDQDAVRSWEDRISVSALWEAHRQAHRRNFERRFSETAEKTDPDERLRPPRYWLLHSLAHALIREMAMYCGYGAASLTERIYAWPEAGEHRPAAAGILVCTTASDSDGTLGGLVRLSEPERLAAIVRSALHRAGRCSSDPLCAMRTPKDPEDFLHGAACHCCLMASETSCERANRFLDRRFLLGLPGSELGFFGDAHDW